MTISQQLRKHALYSEKSIYAIPSDKAFNVVMYDYGGYAARFEDRIEDAMFWMFIAEALEQS